MLPSAAALAVTPVTISAPNPITAAAVTAKTKTYDRKKTSTPRTICSDTTLPPSLTGNTPRGCSVRRSSDNV